MIKLLSLFSGIGAFEKALTNLGVSFEVVAYSEIDKYASRAYCLIHNECGDKNQGDIKEIDPKFDLPGEVDLVTYGFPCQDISLAGSMKGIFGETRSGLFFEALRIIKAKKPKVAIAENVKNLTGSTFKEQFNVVLNSLEQAGYNNYWQVLNAADYGVPQSRERVFIVSIRKDCDTSRFKFPKPFPLEKTLNDMLEADVDEKYYVNQEKVQHLIPQLKEKLLSNTIRGGGQRVNGQSPVGFSVGATLSEYATKINKLIDCANTLMARDYKSFGNQAMNGVIEFESG